MALRKATTDDELRALDRVLMASFSIQTSWEQWMDRVGRENIRVLDEGGRIIGGVGFYRMAEWFGGRSVPIAGLAGVGIALDVRGRGHAKAMCGSLLVELAAEGMPLAGLYASTATLYRSIGFEQAGTAITFRAAPSAFGRGDHHGTPCREVDPAKWEVFAPLYDARARSWTGHLDRSKAIWERTVRVRPGVTVHAYTFGDPMEGYVVFHQSDFGERWFDVRIRDCVLASAAAGRRMCALFGDMAALTRAIEWTGCASDPIVSMLPEQRQEVVGNERWMLRILDVGRALEARGYPPIAGEVHLRVRDPLIAANDGTFVLRAHGGKAKVERGGRAEVSLDIRALGAMYSGFAHPSSMIAAGLLEGDAAAQGVTQLAALFAGPEPWCCDHY